MEFEPALVSCLACSASFLALKSFCPPFARLADEKIAAHAPKR